MTIKNNTDNFLKKMATQIENFWQNSLIRKLIIGLVIILLFLWAVSPDTTKSGSDANARSLAVMPVVVTPVKRGNLTIYLYGLGAVTPINTVEIRSRVDGQLMQITFKEGEMVKAGDLLAQIDPQPFKVELELAQGQLVRDQALLNKAQVDLARYRKLLRQNSISPQLVDTKESLVREYQAAVKADEGAVTSAKLKLTYARITSPISGRVGLRQVDPGNIVNASDPRGIVRITQLDPISVVFPIPEDAIPRVKKLLESGKEVPVDIFDRSLKQKIARGRLLAIDNQIDASTGTIKVKAEVANPDDTLFANQFVNVKMPVETLVDALLIPTVAIQRGAPGTFVYRLNSDKTVSVVIVKVASTQGEVTAIAEGLTDGAIVVTEGADKLRDGAKVKIVGKQTDESNSGGY